MQVLLQDIKKIEADAIIVGFFEDVRPLKGFAGELDWLLCGALSRLILAKKIKGSLGDVALLTSQGKLPTQKIFMIGLGKNAEFTPSALRTAAKIAAATAVNAAAAKVAIEFFLPSEVSYDSSVEALTEGLFQGDERRRLDISLLVADAAAYEKISRLLNHGR